MSQCTRAPGVISWGAGWVSRTPGTAKTHTKQYHSALSGENTDHCSLRQLKKAQWPQYALGIDQYFVNCSQITVSPPLQVLEVILTE